MKEAKVTRDIKMARVIKTRSVALRYARIISAQGRIHWQEDNRGYIVTGDEYILGNGITGIYYFSK